MMEKVLSETRQMETKRAFLEDIYLSSLFVASLFISAYFHTFSLTLALLCPSHCTPAHIATMYFHVIYE